jgi:hypothetical protein
MPDPIALPLLNISDPTSRDAGKAMLDAAARYGFLYVDSAGTAFEAEDVDRVFGLVCTT